METNPSVNFNPERNAHKDNFEVWYQMSSSLFDSLPVNKSHTSCYSATGYKIKGLIFTNVSFELLKFKRTTSHLCQDESEFFLFQYYKEGQQKGYLDNGLFFCNKPGIISLQDLAHGYNAVGQSADNYGVLIPRHLILAHDRLYLQQPYISWSIDSAQGSILYSTFSTIWGELPKASKKETNILSSSFLGLLNGLLTPLSNDFVREEFEQATFRAMKDYLLANLQNVNLDIEHLCQKFCCSRASVYRLFKNVGGVKTFLRQQRLRSCFQELEAVTDNLSPGVIDIASKYGFYNQASFSKLFKKQYGLSPSELRNISFKLNTIQIRKARNTYEYEVKKFKNWLRN